MRHLPTGPSADELPDHPFDRPEDRDLFLRLVREHLGRDGGHVRIRDGVAEVAGRGGLMGLANLAQTCRQQPTCLWRQTIATHLDKSDERRVLPALQSVLGAGFDAVAGSLALRLHPEEYVLGMQEQLVFRVDLPRTATLLVLDLPGSMLAVPAPLLAEWGVPRERLFERALQNVVAMAPAVWERWPLPPGVEIDVLSCGNDYTTTHALRLGECLPRRGRHGNLIAVPHRQVMLSHPIEGSSVLRIVPALLDTAMAMHRDGPGSISPHLFWHRPDGGFEVQQGIGRGRPRLAASPAFALLLRRLRRGDA